MSSGARSSPFDSCTFRCCSSREQHSDDHTREGRMLNPSTLHHKYSADARTCRVRTLPCTTLYTMHKHITHVKYSIKSRDDRIDHFTIVKKTVGLHYSTIACTVL